MAAVNQSLNEVLTYMQKVRFRLKDLVEIGGEDLPGTRAIQCEKCWALMAKNGIKFADLAKAAGQYPALTA